jgi:cholestenol Delta-isomerase
MTNSSHPYSPLTAHLPTYTPNDRPVSELLIKFGGTAAVLLATTWVLLRRWKPQLSSTDKATTMWFVVTGFLHIIFEGYFVYNCHRMPEQMDILGQLWKEYALSDSRYLTTDTFVLSIETLTVLLWGPLSLFTAFSIATANPIRHASQIMICLAHIYGCMLYFATATVDFWINAIEHSRPETLYFWVYYVGLNAVFLVIPLGMFHDCLRDTADVAPSVTHSKPARGEGGLCSPSANDTFRGCQ